MSIEEVLEITNWIENVDGDDVYVLGRDMKEGIKIWNLFVVMLDFPLHLDLWEKMIINSGSHVCFTSMKVNGGEYYFNMHIV